MTKSQKIFWIIFDAVLFGGYFLYGIALADPIGAIRYYDGLNDTSYAFTLVLVMVSYTALAYIGILSLRLYFWKTYFNNQRTLRKVRIVMISLMVIFSPVTLLFLIKTPGYKPFTHGFYNRMQERFDAKAVRIWMNSLDQSMFDDNYYSPDGLRAQKLPVPLPQKIKGLSENISYLKFYLQNQHRFLRVEWGGPFSRWGVVVGPEQMSIPLTEDVSYDENGLPHIGEYRMSLEDGVYVWHEIK